MILIRRSMLLVMLLGLSGCITDQFGSPPAAAGPGQGTITITRSDDVTYRAAAASVELNGKQIATLAAGRSYTEPLSPGPVVVKVSAWTAPLNMASHRLPSGSTSYHFNVEPGKSYSFVISPRGEPIAHDAGAGAGPGEATEGSGGPFQIAAAQ
jgi:hypothetical protein